MSMFTKDEFNIMVEQLMNGEHVSFDMLCSIVEHTLRSSVRRWCAEDSALCGKGLEDDIMQDIQLRLIKTCKASFFLRNGLNGPVNNDPDGFKNWMFKVALNIKRDYANYIRSLEKRTRAFNDGEEDSLEDESDFDNGVTDERREILRDSFSIVLNSDVQVYKIITWIAQCLLILELDVPSARINRTMVKMFEEKTLSEMFMFIKSYSKLIPWLYIDEKQDAKINYQLQKKWDDDHTYGQVKYKEFFMKKGGRASASDWVNRMNNLIKRVIGNETPDK